MKPTDAANWRCLQVSIFVLIAAPAARADEIHIGGKVHRNVSVRNFDGEFVIFATQGGETLAKPIREIDAIYADSVRGLEDFNRAERLFSDREYAKAKDKYELALPRTRSFWNRIIRVRIIMAYDAAGELDLATERFVKLVEVMPDKADVFMPVNIEDAGDQRRQRALSILQNALAEAKGQMVYWQLEGLRLAILEKTEGGNAGEVASGIVDKLQGSPNLRSRHRLQMIAVRVEVKHEQYPTALAHVNTLIAEADKQFLPELLFLKGKCLFGIAESRDDYIKSGLAFMRVIIHFPKSRHCARSMYWAALVHEKIGRPAKAVQLYAECVNQPGADPELLERAANAVQRLKPQVHSSQ